MNQGQPQILDRMTDLADGLRGRLLLLLEQHELTVSELCAIVQSPQSTVSRHLKTLADGEWVRSRPDATRRLYRMRPELLAPASGELWRLIREQLLAAPLARQDAPRLRAVLAERRGRSRRFFDSEADGWDRVRDELFGTRFFLFGLPALLDPNWVVGDLGCGSGPVTEALAPWVRRVIAVDGSESMLSAAGRRLGDRSNVDLRHGELEALPVADQELDAATLVLVLHHLADPTRALCDVARVLRPGGTLLLVDMQPHDRAEYRQEMGHVWLGFSEEQIVESLAAAGFSRPTLQPLPTEPAAAGPALFAARAVRNNELSTSFIQQT